MNHFIPSRMGPNLLEICGNRSALEETENADVIKNEEIAAKCLGREYEERKGALESE
jgi:hypothetical protein